MKQRLIGTVCAKTSIVGAVGLCLGVVGIVTPAFSTPNPSVQRAAVPARPSTTLWSSS